MKRVTKRSSKNKPKRDYSLRSHNVFLISPATTKLEYEQQEGPKPLFNCPIVPRKSSILFHKEKSTLAVAIGRNGKLSLLYNRSVDILYVDQLFIEIEKIGEGSYGTVNKYRSREDGHFYAIKVVKHFTSTDKFSEVRCLDRIANNPNCMHYVNAWEEGGVIYIQFELAVMSLAAYAQKNHKISEEECWNILFDVLKALIPMHKKGLCHNDIKPDNIVITNESKYNLCDFGLLSKPCRRKSRNNIFGGSVPEGDGKYIAIEVLKGRISTASDIFALGITLLELSMDLLLPVNGPRWHDLRKCSWRSLPKTIQGRISFDLETTINWMMQLNPQERPTAEQLMRTPVMLQRLRAKKPRFDHFGAWRLANEEAKDETKMPIISLDTPDNSRPSTPCSPISYQSLSPVVTPPRRVSSVIIRKSFPRLLLPHTS